MMVLLLMNFRQYRARLPLSRAHGVAALRKFISVRIPRGGMDILE